MWDIITVVAVLYRNRLAVHLTLLLTMTMTMTMMNDMYCTFYGTVV